MTAQPSRSYLKVPYDLRMAKQIERRMIADLLIRLRGGGFDISNYQYTGMGSIYFVDFSIALLESDEWSASNTVMILRGE